MSRKLASIQKVKSIEPVITRDGEVAHSVELIRFEDIGWQCIAKKGDFSVGDKAVYIEISTVVPQSPCFEFLRAKGFKVKTQKFVGTTLSQGLAMPLEILYELVSMLLELDEETLQEDLILGSDVSELIGVTRYDPETYDVKTHGDAKGSFREDICPKTDQERIQSAPFLLERSKQFAMVATLKIDGMSASYFWEDGELQAMSRNIWLKPAETVYWNVAKKYNLAKVLELNPKVALQGEVVGPKIQKNRLGIEDHDLYIFGAWLQDEARYMTFAELTEFCVTWGLQRVPPVKFWDAGTFEETIDSLLELAKGLYEYTKNHREGLVIRPWSAVVFEQRIGAQLSYKVINNDYLLGGGE